MTEQEVAIIKKKLIIEEDNVNNNENDENDEWAHIFKCISYDGTNEITINSGQIKDAGRTWKGRKSQFEPRLLCKQDTYEKRPEISFFWSFNDLVAHTRLNSQASCA